MKIETRFDIGQRFLVYNITTERMNYRFVKCEKCDDGIYLGPKGQKHRCRSCDTMGAFKFLPRGYLMDHDSATSGRVMVPERVVINIQEVEVEEIRITLDGKEPCVSYVYEFDYDGDNMVGDDQIYLTVEEVIAAALADQTLTYRISKMAPFGGVVYTTEITLA
jgi:hypothetical protein